MTSTLTWALLGASDIAATRMIDVMKERGDTLAMVVSSSSDRGATFKDMHGIAASTTSLDEALSSQVDAVYISTTNERHHEMALAAITAGKHVLCEKPLALTVQDAQQMIDAAHNAGVVLATNHHLPGSPLHRRTRDLISEGAIGNLIAARVMHAVALPERLRGWRVDADDNAGGGVIMDITCHDASVLNPLFGGLPDVVTAIATKQAPWGCGGYDGVMTVLGYPGPDGKTRLAQTHDAFTVTHDTTRLEVMGTSGLIRVTDAMTQDAAGRIEIVTEAGTETIAIDNSENLYRIVLDSFASAIEGTGSPTADGRDGLNALRVALAAIESARSGNSSVPIEHT